MGAEYWKEENLEKLPESEKLGKGAFGIVIIHKDDVDGGIYACKIINLTKTKTEYNLNLKKIVEEVKVLKKLENQHVVRYYGYEFKGPNAEDYANDPTKASIVASLNSGGYCEVSDYLIIRMELCSCSLESMLANIKFQEKYLILEQISKALCYIHSQGVIHRDIKPGNILVKINRNNNSEVECVKLADFGLALVKGDNKIKSKAGTLKYMSPEMMKNDENYCEKTDVFSTGLVFLEVLIGKLESRSSLLQIAGDIAAWNEFNLSTKVGNLVKGMLSEEANKRLDAQKVLTSMTSVCKLVKNGTQSDFEEEDEFLYSGNESSVRDSVSRDCQFVWMDVRNEVDNFEGRKSELNRLKKSFKKVQDKLKGSGGGRNKEKLHLIHGLGGNGKTELAVKFMNCFRGRVNGAWLRGENETTLRTSVNKLALLLKLELKGTDGVNKPSSVLLEELSSKLEESRVPWLFVVDNVDKDHLKARETIFTLQDTPKVFVVVTSQCPLAVMNRGVDLPLEPLTSKDAEEFVRKAMEMGEVDENIRKLCHVLGNLPLALQQAVAHIIMQKRDSLIGSAYGAGHYIEEYTKSIEQQKTLLNIAHTMTKEEQTVYNTINMALNKIRVSNQGSETSQGYFGLFGWALNSLLQATGLKSSEEPPSIRLLYYLAYLDPDCIPLNILEAYMNEVSTDWTPKLIKNSLQELKSRSIIQSEFIEGEPVIIRLHRVVQTIMRISDTELCKDKPPYLCELSVASCSLLDSDKYSKDHLQQAMVLWNIVKEREEVLRHKNVKEMPGKMARQMLILIQYVDVLKHTEEALPIMSRVFGETDPRTALKMKRWRGCALGHTKDLPRSLEVLTETHQEMSQVLGEDDDDTLNVADSRAMILKDNQKFEEAEDVHRRCIELCVKKTGKEMTSRIAALTQNMGMTLIELWKRDNDEAKIDEALRNYENAMNWYKSTEGENHGDTLTALGNLAFGYYEKGDRDSLEKAKEMYDEVINLSRSVLGKEHSSTLVSSIYLARVLKGLGETDESRELFQELLDPLEKVIGTEHHFYKEARREVGLPEILDNTVLRVF